ncbi:helix-turn-helix domain-containing protein, partial [Pedobacter petrophilus]
FCFFQATTLGVNLKLAKGGQIYWYMQIERAKELILYDELNLTEISYLLNYSSVAHLSRQFKQVTGLTASFFRNAPFDSRIALENV